MCAASLGEKWERVGKGEKHKDGSGRVLSDVARGESNARTVFASCSRTTTFAFRLPPRADTSYSTPCFSSCGESLRRFQPPTDLLQGAFEIRLRSVSKGGYLTESPSPRMRAKCASTNLPFLFFLLSLLLPPMESVRWPIGATLPPHRRPSLSTFVSPPDLERFRLHSTEPSLSPPPLWSRTRGPKLPALLHVVPVVQGRPAQTFFRPAVRAHSDCPAFPFHRHEPLPFPAAQGPPPLDPGEDLPKLDRPRKRKGRGAVQRRYECTVDGCGKTLAK